MKKMKKLVMFLLLTGILCGLCGCKEEAYEKEIVIRSFDADEYADVDFTLENEDLLFQMDPATTIFTVTQKSTGKVGLRAHRIASPPLLPARLMRQTTLWPMQQVSVSYSPPSYWSIRP